MNGFPNSATDAELEARAKELLSGTPKEPTSLSAEFRISFLQSYYTIDGIVCGNALYRLDLFNSFLDETALRKPDEWIEYNKSHHNDFVVAPAHLQFCMLKALYENREGPFKARIETLRTGLLRQCLEMWVATSTRILYSASGRDEIIHDYNVPGHQIGAINLKGNDDFLRNVPDEITQKIIGCDSKTANEVACWISGKGAYLWRRDTVGERTVTIGAYKCADRLGVTIGESLDLSSRAFGIHVVSKRPIGGAQ